MASAPAAPGAPGWKLPGYVIDDLIGYGATAEVWRAHGTRTGEPVAVKRFVLPDAAQRRAANAEAALLAALDHPHLVRLHEVLAAGDSVALVLELAGGGSLGDLLARRGRLGVGEVVTALSPIAAALAYAHDEGVTHCDVSPANVLFTADGRPLLADLGVARIVGHGDQLHGTPAYVDPVVAAGAAPGAPTDVFGVAAAALHALTGAPPSPGDSPRDCLALAVTGEIPDLAARLESLPGAVAEVVARGLAAEPHRRGTAAEFALDLRHAARPVPVELAAGRPVSRPVPPVPVATPQPAPGRHALADDGAPDGADPHGADPDGADPGGASAPPASPAPVRLDRPAWRHTGGDDEVEEGAGAGDVHAGLRALATRRVPGQVRERFTAPPRGRLRTVRAALGRGLSSSAFVRGAVAAAVVLVAVGGLAVAAVRWWPHPMGARHDSSSRALAGQDTTGPSVPRSSAPLSSRPTPRPTSTGTDFGGVLAALDRARVGAYAAGAPGALAGVYVPGRLLDEDSATLAASVPRGCSLTGAVTTYRSVAATALGQGRWRVRAVATLAAGTVRCGQQVTGTTAPAGPVPMTLVVAWTPAGWRIAELTVTG